MIPATMAGPSPYTKTKQNNSNKTGGFSQLWTRLVVSRARMAFLTTLYTERGSKVATVPTGSRLLSAGSREWSWWGLGHQQGGAGIPANDSLSFVPTSVLSVGNPRANRSHSTKLLHKRASLGLRQHVSSIWQPLLSQHLSNTLPLPASGISPGRPS